MSNTNSYIYMVSKPPGMVMPNTATKSYDECILKAMDETDKSWEWLKDHGYTVDKYEVNDA